MRAVVFALAVLGVIVPSLADTASVRAQTLSAEQVESVAETRWSGVMLWESGSRYDATLYFRADGVLIYAYDGSTYDNGRWVQREGLVTFHTNTYYAVYTGLIDGMVYRGYSHNVAGDTGYFGFTRLSAGEDSPGLGQ